MIEIMFSTGIESNKKKIMFIIHQQGAVETVDNSIFKKLFTKFDIKLFKLLDNVKLKVALNFGFLM